jgi:hypothetical protein
MQVLLLYQVDGQEIDNQQDLQELKVERVLQEHKEHKVRKGLKVI